MKPTENTFFFPFNSLRLQATPPIEKVELLEYPKSFDLFDLFERRVSVGETGGRGGVTSLQNIATGPVVQSDFYER